MDPITFAVLFSTITSVLGPMIDTTVNSIKNKKDVQIDDIRNLVDHALNLAYNESNRKGDILANKLMSLSVIQRTPALAKAIDKAYDKVKSEIADLDTDYANKELQSLKIKSRLDEAYDANIFNKGNNINKIKENINEEIQKIHPIEKVIT